MPQTDKLSVHEDEPIYLDFSLVGIHPDFRTGVQKAGLLPIAAKLLSDEN